MSKILTLNAIQAIDILDIYEINLLTVEPNSQMNIYIDTNFTEDDHILFPLSVFTTSTLHDEKNEFICILGQGWGGGCDGIKTQRR